MSCQSCVRASPRSSALIHHTAFYMDQYEWDSLHKRQQLLRRDAEVIDNISPALHTHAHLYSWLEKGPWCPLTSTVPIISGRRTWHQLRDTATHSDTCQEMSSFSFIKYSVTAIDRSLLPCPDICIFLNNKGNTGNQLRWHLWLKMSAFKSTNDPFYYHSW